MKRLTIPGSGTESRATKPARVSAPATLGGAAFGASREDTGADLLEAAQAAEIEQQARLQTLHARLEAVREIKEGMGLHSPKIEELATRKMRAENPELASDWDAMREAARRHELLMRKQEQERKQSQAQERPGRSQSLGLSARPA